MASHAIFIGWNVPVRGREKQAAELFTKSLEYYGTLQAQGKIESFEPVILSRHGGDLNGFILLRGEADKLNALRNEDAFLDMVIEGGNLIDGFGIIDAYINDGLADMMVRWNKEISK